MYKRSVRLFLVATLAICFLGVMAGTASAHHPIITATASCSNGAAIISYTSTSWDPGFTDGVNPEIDILFDGVKVDMGAYTFADGFQFSNQKPAPAAALSVDVEALVVGIWGDGFAAGQSAVVTVTIPTDCSTGIGRFTGGGKQVDISGLTITKGFEVDCDLHQPSNNLEINWADASGGSHHFHMLNFLSAACAFNGNPKPPVAPVNTIVASGTGRYDGVDGFTVEFTLIDNGEPGAGNDAAGFKVYETLNPSNVVLNFTVQFVTKGNIQAHVDQK